MRAKRVRAELTNTNTNKENFIHHSVPKVQHSLTCSFGETFGQ